MPAEVNAPLRPCAGRASRGFTLIELLVVVGIIALISGLLLPVLIQARDRARKRAAQRQPQAQEYASAPSEPPGPPLPAGLTPIVDVLDLKLDLASSYHRIGMDVFTRYRVECTGRVMFRHPGGTQSGPVLVIIPFPAHILEARDVELSVLQPGTNKPLLPRELVYTREGIFFTYPMTPGQSLTADVAFTALGRDQLDYALPPAQQLRSVAITLDLPGVPSKTIPDDSLQPSAVAPGQIRWEFKNLVSDRHLVVQIPAAQAPLARALVLTRLVAVAVLLFGAGFWFLSEQSRPGQLDHFRLGHFLLLALTYSLFFVIFAVLELDGKLRTSQSLAASAVFAVPLLVLHVSRVLNLRFAITRVIPLALFTLGLVLNGVYGDTYRDYVYIGAIIFLIAYVTLGYESWADRRTTYQRERELAHAARRSTLTEQITRVLGAQIAELSSADAEAAAYLKPATADSPEATAPELAGARARLERAREPVAALVKDYEELAKRLTYLAGQSPWEAAELMRSLQREAGAFTERLAPRMAQLQSELLTWRLQPAPAVPAGEGEAHCAACGRQAPDAPFCPYCGAARPAIPTCAGCGERIVIPLHLLAAGRITESVFCPHCGTGLTVPRCGEP